MGVSHIETYDVVPRSKGRVRVTARGTYTPKKTVDFEKAVAEGWSGPKLDGPVYMIVTLGKDWFQVEVGEIDEPSRPNRVRGDCSNVLKAIEDGLNGVAYGDDRQIKVVTVEK